MVTGFAEHKTAMCMLIANFSHETGNYRWMKEIADGTAYNNRSEAWVMAPTSRLNTGTAY